MSVIVALAGSTAVALGMCAAASALVLNAVPKKQR